MSAVPSSPADRGIDPRQGDLLELLGLAPEQLERSRYARRPEQGPGGAEASSRPRAGADQIVLEERRGRGREVLRR